MIILEGVDRVGKSSVAKALMRYLPDYKYVHCEVPPEGEHVLDYHTRLLGLNDKKFDGKLIVDRLHWSEYSYGITYRSGCKYTQSQWNSLEDRLLNASAHVILMSDAVKLIRERWDENEQFDVAGLIRLNGLFFDLFFDRAERLTRLSRTSLNWRDLFNPNGSERGDSLKVLADMERERAS